MDQIDQKERRTPGDFIAWLWIVVQADMTKIAAPALFIVFVASTATMAPGTGSEKIMIIVVQVFLDFAGAGLLVMAGKGAKKNRLYQGLGVLLIGLTITTALLATLSGMFPDLMAYITGVNDILTLIRSVLSVIYGVVIHSEHNKQEREKKVAIAQQQREDKVAEANDKLAIANASELAVIKDQVNDLTTMIGVITPIIQTLQQAVIDQSAKSQQIIALLEQNGKESAKNIQQISKDSKEQTEALTTNLDGLAELNLEIKQSIEQLANRPQNVTPFPARSAKTTNIASKNNKEEGFEEKDTSELPAFSADVLALIEHLSASEELAHISKDDIASVVQEYAGGTSKSKIYLKLGWGSSKHTNIVKPVVDAYMQVSKEQQAVAN